MWQDLSDRAGALPAAAGVPAVGPPPVGAAAPMAPQPMTQSLPHSSSQSVSRARDEVIAYRKGAPIAVDQFLQDVRHLAAQLPAGSRVVNLCADRYRFAVALVAAWEAGRECLLPPNTMPETLDAVRAQRPGDLVLLVDEPLGPVAGASVVRVEAPGPAACEAAGGAWQPLSNADPAGEAVCLMTSGSTGAPQPHGKRFGPLQVNIAAEAARLAEFLGRPDLRGLTLVASVPPQHSYGLESSVLLAVLGGATLDAGRPFYPADIAAALAAVPRPRALVTTPFHLKNLLLSGVALPPVDLVLSATAPLSPQLAAQAEATFGGVLVEIYGCTEAGQVAARRTTEGQRWTTLGALRLAARSTPDGDRFVVSGGHVTEPTELADVLELDDAQHFRLLGRANDLIHVAGKRSSLAYLSFQLNRIEGVEDGCFWMPDDVADGVVRPVAFVVAPTLTAASVIAQLRTLVEPAFVPRRVVHVEALPRNATGKLTAQALRAFAAAAPRQPAEELRPASPPAALGASGAQEPSA